MCIHKIIVILLKHKTLQHHFVWWIYMNIHTHKILWYARHETCQPSHGFFLMIFRLSYMCMWVLNILVYDFVAVFFYFWHKLVTISHSIIFVFLIFRCHFDKQHKMSSLLLSFIFVFLLWTGLSIKMSVCVCVCMYFLLETFLINYVYRQK